MTNYKEIELADRDVLSVFFTENPPQTSELTFTNLFIWRRYYQPKWREFDGCLLIQCHPPEGTAFGLPPVGSGDKTRAVNRLMDDLASAGHDPRIHRADRELVEQYVDPDRYTSELDRSQSDYVYLKEKLAQLSGRKMHQKKNHLNQFVREHHFESLELDSELIAGALEMQESWCELRQCALDPSLAGEDRAVYEAFTHFDELKCRGLAIVIDGKVEAFTIAEPLNTDTIVIHIEKANPDFRGLYATINQRFCALIWPEYRYVNREQDLGVEGLRKAKESYHPDHMVDKFIVYPSPR